MAPSETRMRDLVARLGAHPTSRLGLDLSIPSGRAGWWLTAVILGAAASEERAMAAASRLSTAGLAEPRALAGADPADVAPLLAELGQSRVGPAAARLVRTSRALESPGGDLERIAAESDSLEELGIRLVKLCSGVGRATVLRFLRPLRDEWACAGDVPITPPARTAALHLGWLEPGTSPEIEPQILRERHGEEPGAPALIDAEAALERLGARACRRDRVDRCPLGADCPRLGARPLPSEPLSD